MKIEDQVCSLELAKRLKELGVKQESLLCWYWHQWPDHPNSWPGPIKPADDFELMIGRPYGQYVEDVWQGGEIYSAFTVAELGEMLPPFWSGKQGDLFHCRQRVYEPDQSTQTAIVEAEARAKMLIYLLENRVL